jgi:hypothetical protein
VGAFGFEILNHIRTYPVAIIIDPLENQIARKILHYHKSSRAWAKPIENYPRNYPSLHNKIQRMIYGTKINPPISKSSHQIDLLLRIPQLNHKSPLPYEKEKLLLKR